jgi:hypothetical protein
MLCYSHTMLCDYSRRNDSGSQLQVAYTMALRRDMSLLCTE